MKSEENYQGKVDKKGKEYHKRKANKRSLMGIIFIVVGLVLIASKLDVISDSVRHVIVSWPMLLIGIGAFNILTNKNYSSGLILITIGSFFILPRMFDIPFEVKDMFWPAIFVAIGVIMLTVKNRHKKFGDNESSEHEIDMLTLFGGGNRKITSDEFLGGKVTSIFGGSEIDLVGAKLKEEQCVIDAFTMFGGVEISVPKEWEVQVDVTSIFGGFNDKRGRVESSLGEDKKILIIKGFAIFGGGEVKSY